MAERKKTMTFVELNEKIQAVLRDDGTLDPSKSYKSVLGDDWRPLLKNYIAHMPTENLRSHISYGNDKVGDTLNFNVPAGHTCSAEARKTCSKDGCYAKKDERYVAPIIARYENLNLFLKDPARLEREINEAIAKAKKMRYFKDQKTGKYWSERAIAGELKRRKKENPAEYKGAKPKDLIAELQLVEVAADEVDVKFYFRLHESGDFFCTAYVDMWLRIMANHPDVRFYTYTKQFDIIRQRLQEILATKNFSLMLSAWTGLPLPQDLVDAGFGVAYCDDGIEDRIPQNAWHCKATASNSETCMTCGYKCAVKGLSVVFKKH